MKSMKTTSNKQSGPQWWLCWFMGIVILLAGGWAYRHFAPAWVGTGQTIINLPVPLSEFPDQVGQWQGSERQIASVTESYMRRNFADDYFSKRFTNKTHNQWADLYVVYCASRPSAIKGHRPRVCYVNSGWIHDSTETSEFTTLSGTRVPCLVHRFHKPPPSYVEYVVMNFYIVSGQLTNSEDEISRMVGRNPNSDGDPAKYVSQVQVSSTLETNVRAAAADLVDMVLYYLPDENGLVHADLGAPIDPNAQ